MKAASKAVESAPVESVTEHASTSIDFSALLHNANTWIAVSFVIFLLLMLRYVRPMLTKTLDERSEKIRTQLEQASRLRAEAAELLNVYRAQQEALVKEAAEIIAQAKSDAAALRAQASEDLKATIARRTQQAKEKIARAEAEAVGEIRQRIIDAATASTRLALAGNVGADADAQAISRAIEQVERKIG